MIINSVIIQKMKKDNQIKADLVVASGKSYPTISRWINNNDERLTMKVCLNVIKKRYDLHKDEELFETESTEHE